MIVYNRTKTVLEKIGVEITQKIKSELRQKNLIASGATERETRSEVQQETGKMFLKVLSKENKGVAILDALDTGISPGKMPNVSAIKKWIEDRGFQSRRKGRFVSNTETNLKRAAYGIAKAIMTKGTIRRFGYSGAGIYRNAMLSDQRTGQRVADAIVKDIQDYLDTKIDAKS